MVLFDDEPSTEERICERCRRDCEPIEIEKCPICAKRFCNQCAHRLGSNRYCSRNCGETFYYGDEDDEGSGL